MTLTTWRKSSFSVEPDGNRVDAWHAFTAAVRS
jgi:hypothetical protein